MLKKYFIILSLWFSVQLQGSDNVTAFLNLCLSDSQSAKAKITYRHYNGVIGTYVVWFPAETDKEISDATFMQSSIKEGDFELVADVGCKGK
jgi:hypothetical protein